jgi:transposase
MPNIPPRANRRWKNRFSPVLYRDRNAVERMVCRLKDFRRIATRHDRLAVNFRAAVSIAATVTPLLRTFLPRVNFHDPL